MKVSKKRLNKLKNTTKKRNRGLWFPVILVCIIVAYIAYSCITNWPEHKSKTEQLESATEFDSYRLINGNKPYFTEDDYKLSPFESYSELDKLGRCGVAFACVGKETMPTEERGTIGNVKPSGWKQAKYEGVVDSNPPYLYNRCHLIAYCLTGENDNEKNLITGTRYMNIEGMLPFEQEVARYLSYTDNHVLYRVTPMYTGNNLLADGVLMEAYSIEDKGAGISFCVYVYNKQPGVEIDYKTGESRLSGETL